eukprot:976123_1
MNTNPQNAESLIKYKHVSVELKCPLLPPSSLDEDAIIIQLPSTSDWAVNFDFILKSIPNKFELFTNIDDSQWLLILDGKIIDKHNPIAFGRILSTQIPPLATLEVVDFATLWSRPPPSNLSRPRSDIVYDPTQSFNINETNNAIDLRHDDFKLNWNHLVSCIRHEMWPILASVIKGMLDNNNDEEAQKANPRIDIHDLSDECMDKVIDMLKRKRRLPSEECRYLRQLMIRAKGFDPHYLNLKKDHNDMDMNSIDYHKKGLSKCLLMDIYGIHKAFVFTNFNFEEYTIRQFMEDITGAFGAEFMEEFADNLSFEPRFDLHPTFIVEDDIFRVFEYHFAVSLFVNRLKHNLYIAENSFFEVQSIVIPGSVSCVYDDGNSDMTLNDNIGSMHMYLTNKAIDFYKIRFKSDAIKDPIDVANKIEEHYDLEDFARNKTSKLMIIIDRKGLRQTKHDSMYIFPYTNSLSELQLSHCVAFDFKIIHNSNLNSNIVVTYFRFGTNGITRFFSELLVSIMPRLFRKPIRFSNAEYLNMLYHNSFRNGWCVTLKDEIFDTYYKMITKVTHVCVNYNRAILYDEFFDTKPMLCFTDLLHHELEIHRHFNTNDIHRMNSFFDEHEYCTDAIIDDIHDDHGSNLEVSMKSKRKQNQFDIIRKIVRKYNGPAQKEKAKMCKIDHVLSAEKCPLIRIIIDGLKQHNSETMHATHHVNIADLLAAYDHMISVHGLCASLSDPRLAETNESKPFEDMDHAQHTAGAHVYILSEIGGYCTSKACPILQKHIMRRRERQKEEMKDDHKSNSSDGLDEILHATLNALHCYILHEKKK